MSNEYIVKLRVLVAEATIARNLASDMGYRRDCINVAVAALQGALDGAKFDLAERLKHERKSILESIQYADNAGKKSKASGLYDDLRAIDQRIKDLETK